MTAWLAAQPQRAAMLADRRILAVLHVVAAQVDERGYRIVSGCVAA
jgi:hypothetical protein